MDALQTVQAGNNMIANLLWVGSAFRKGHLETTCAVVEQRLGSVTLFINPLVVLENLRVCEGPMTMIYHWRSFDHGTCTGIRLVQLSAVDCSCQINHKLI